MSGRIPQTTERNEFMARKSGLGRGLNALFDESALNLSNSADSEDNILHVRISDIEPDKTQPRKNFEPESLSSLADSISTHGILQPIVVRRPEGSTENEADGDESSAVKRILGGKYKIVAGERRWRAAKMAGLSEVPVIVRNFTDRETAAIMLVENLQREDLNPVEQARGLSRLIEEFQLTQEEAANAVGISRPALTNALRLLTLPDETLEHLEKGDITAGHARALITVGNADTINSIAETIIAKGLSVREVERLVKNMSSSEKEKTPKVPTDREIYYEKLESDVASRLGRKVKIVTNSKNDGGVLEINYHGSRDLESILKTLCGEGLFTEE